MDTYILPPKVKSKTFEEAEKKEPPLNLKVTELVMQRWSGEYSRPFLFGILDDGTMLSYHAYIYEGMENAPKIEDVASTHASGDISRTGASRLRNLRLHRVSIDINTREESSNLIGRPRITIFKNVGGYQGLFLTGSRPAWLMLCRERLRVHPQACFLYSFPFIFLFWCNRIIELIYVYCVGTSEWHHKERTCSGLLNLNLLASLR